ncbi:hypothetical protein GW626_08580 [Peribacillus muralis]|uniref:hypothetical protein n=1 Tax=Peribacillus muralis TaxID=264697 RepID=UPI00349EED84
MYNIISVHDFPIIKDQDWIQLYPSYKEKLHSRIRKFFDILANSQSVLFVRWGAVSIPQAAELGSVLASITPGKCNILFLDPVAGLPSVKELDWGIDGTCTVQVPS